jgi:hypothetical protein
MCRLATALACLGVLAGCGGDGSARQEFNRIRSVCGTLVGRPVREAAAQLGPFGSAGLCTGDQVPLGAADVCGGAPGAGYTSPICDSAFEFCGLGTSVCSGGPQGGCAFACEFRVAAATPDAITADSVICAVRFVSGQAFGVVSGLPCR